jgi:hypothetical protein
VGENGDGWVEVVMSTGVRMLMEWGVGFGHLGRIFSKTVKGNKKKGLTITANNIHGDLKEIKRASQIPEGRPQKKPKHGCPSSQ